MMEKEFTFENVELVAQAFSDFIKEDSKKKKKINTPKVVIGFDTRQNSEAFAKTFTEVLIANAIEVCLSSQACPTPAVSFAIAREGFDAGIVVTASHNPSNYNGIK